MPSRPALQRPPLADLLPKGYLSALRRTDGRVRFQSGDGNFEDSASRATARSAMSSKNTRPKQQSPLRAKSRSVSRQRKVRMARNSSSNEDFKAEPRPVGDMNLTLNSGSLPLLDAGPESGLGRANPNGIPSEMSRQVKQLNIPIGTPEVTSGMVHSGEDMLHLAAGDLREPCVEQDEGSVERKEGGIDGYGSVSLSRPAPHRTTSSQNSRHRGGVMTPLKSRHEPPRYSSAISSSFPPNLPLSIIRLVESYVNRFVAADAWSPAQGEKGYLLVSWLA